ncbi:hypothetical protein Hanom_Chr05g00410131 [Helianthus anomalus]
MLVKSYSCFIFFKFIIFDFILSVQFFPKLIIYVPNVLWFVFSHGEPFNLL